MQQTSDCVGKLNVEDINVDRLSLAVRSPQRYLHRSYQIGSSADVAAMLLRFEPPAAAQTISNAIFHKY